MTWGEREGWHARTGSVYIGRWTHRPVGGEEPKTEELDFHILRLEGGEREGNG